MQLPAALRAAMEREALRLPGLGEAARALSDAYRRGAPPPLANDAACAAYAATRLPATYAAARRALTEVPWPLESVVDLGAGAGAASWAAAEQFPLAKLTLVERNARLLDWSRRLGPAAWTRQAGDLASLNEFPPGDLLLFCYSLGELADPLAAMQRAWQAARVALVVIEPGTRAGFAVVHRVREAMRQWVTAPCPQREACPMAAAGDWCHFAARVERTALHRQLKDGTLGHEDEKFSFVVLGKQEAPLAPARIVRHPRAEPGRITLQLCTPAGLNTRVVRKGEAAAWRAARKAEWGGAWTTAKDG